MPFAAKYKEIYTHAYREVCTELGLHCWRVDERLNPGSITRDIVEGIYNADVVIADLTGKNPNVFYELGISHSAGSKTVMTAQSMDDVPFDIRAYRVIIYEHTVDGVAEMKAALRGAIKGVLASQDLPNNPVQDAKRAIGGGSAASPRRPVSELVSVRLLTFPLRQLIRDEQIVFADQLGSIDLDEAVARQGFGKESLNQLCTLLKEFELARDRNALQSFIDEKMVDVKYNRVADFLSEQRSRQKPN